MNKRGEELAVGDVILMDLPCRVRIDKVEPATRRRVVVRGRVVGAPPHDGPVTRAICGYTVIVVTDPWVEAAS